MRIGAILFVAIGVVLIGACTGPAPDDEECTAQAGSCVQGECGPGIEQLVTPAGVCPSGYICCAAGGVDSGASSPVPDAGTSTGSGSGS